MKKNLAEIRYKTSQILIWQDHLLNWVYSIDDGTEISSQSKELQTALNLAYETIDERSDRTHGFLLKPAQSAKPVQAQSKLRPKKTKATKKVASKK
jgi:hypothetical protein